jgi:hypothetical protein
MCEYAIYERSHEIEISENMTTSRASQCEHVISLIWQLIHFNTSLKGTGSQDELGYCGHEWIDLSLNRGRGWFF